VDTAFKQLYSLAFSWLHLLQGS